MGLERPHQAGGRLGGAGLVVAREHESKLVAAQPGDGVRVAQPAAHAFGDLLQHHVSGLVPVGVVDLLETVQIHDQERHRLVLALGRQDGLVQAVE